MKKKFHSFLANKDHPLLQFIKYGLCGGISLIVDISVTFLAAVFLFKALGANDPMVTLFSNLFHTDLPVVIDEALRTRNFLIDATIAFIFSNLTAYVLNIKFVFKAGRHQRHQELIYFYLISGVALVITLSLSALLIRTFGVSSSVTKIVGIFSAVLINYAGRKFLIFKG